MGGGTIGVRARRAGDRFQSECVCVSAGLVQQRQMRVYWVENNNGKVKENGGWGGYVKKR